MRNIKINRNIIIASIIIAVIIPVFFYTKYYLTGDNKPIHNILIGISYSFIVSISIFTVNFNIVTWLHRKYLADKKFIQRMSFEILLTNFNSAIIISLGRVDCISTLFKVSSNASFQLYVVIIKLIFTFLLIIF